jgi:tRNA nucleotidyltransferase/poly(A) polymerase
MLFPHPGVFPEDMADYIYLLESRLSKDQQHALNVLREIARERSLTIFLVGGAVRDLTSGSPVRDLDVVVQGNALKLRKDIEKAGGLISGESDAGQALFIRFPGSVRVELGSTLSISYPKPGKPVAKPAGILDDLRRRDFTANAMALSLNAGSFGLLMDPLNGVADIENRELRLVSNYGFIEDPIRMVRAARLMARLGWGMDEKTQSRYETGKQEGYISAASAFSRGYEAEEVVHEEDPIRVLKRLESEGWLKEIAPAWTAAKANEPELERLRESQTQLQMQGIHPSPAAANFPLLTAKMSAAEIADLKASFPRAGFVREIESLESEAKELAAQLTAKTAALPSQTWKLLYSAKPEAVLQVAFSSKSAAIQAKFKSFFTEWPQARQKVPYALMQEMRIVPELPGYDAFVESLVFELMDGKLTNPEELKAFLEPFSPPAPPPPVHLRRPRAPKKDAKSAKGRAKKQAVADDEETADEAASNSQEAATEAVSPLSAPPEVPTTTAPLTVKKPAPAKAAAAKEAVVPAAPAKAAPAKAVKSIAASAPEAPTAKKTTPAKAAPAKKTVPVNSSAKAAKKVAKAPVAKKVAPAKAPVKGSKPSAKIAPAKKQAAKPASKPVGKAAVKKPAAKVSVKAAAKPLAKAAPKPAAKPPAKGGKTSAKPVAKKAAAPAKKSAAAKKRR